MSSELATIPPMTGGPNDRTMALSATPSEILPSMLLEIQERSRLIRTWIFEQMTPGVHFGVPPGVKQDDKDPTRWKSKPSLYQAGADAVIAAEKVVPEFAADETAWRMMGGKTGMMVWRCRLRSQLTGVIMGEGVGAARVPENADDFNLNKGVKMACKRAKVAAVLNAYGLSDLFTQDMEDGGGKEPGQEPAQNPDAPVAQTREQSVSPEEFMELSRRWRLKQADREAPADKNEWEIWVNAVTGLTFAKLRKQPNWTREHYDACVRDLEGSR